MADLNEVLVGLRATLLADVPLRGLLGSATNIVTQDPRRKMPYPLIHLAVRDYQPDVELTGIGKYQPTLQVNIFAVEQQSADAIFERVQTLLSVPTATPIAIATAHYRIDSVRVTGYTHVGPVRLLNDETDVLHSVIEANLRVVRVAP
jgi:hypothetical protein